MSRPGPPQLPESHPRVGHETTDASVFYVGLFGLALALMIALVIGLLVWMFWQFEASAERADPVASPLAHDQTPPEPRLQTRPAAELTELRHAEDQTLGSYKWIDQQQGIVQIPIERAIDLLTERGLPEPPAAEPIATPREPTP